MTEIQSTVFPNLQVGVARSFFAAGAAYVALPLPVLAEAEAARPAEAVVVEGEALVAAVVLGEERVLPKGERRPIPAPMLGLTQLSTIVTI